MSVKRGGIFRRMSAAVCVRKLAPPRPPTVARLRVLKGVRVGICI